ncbi:KRAB [Lepeophtheirus salmonis]|uniref:KRAB n=1 Tax=Lepeophtheirus salmonis TaxID=72036 RepID=A0A7R8HAT4_LEPSM|nr:KRAB [Lepeophtheirus salmonis]CAF2975161.1 KRAB [Lepeophtheirus salmonis]
MGSLLDIRDNIVSRYSSLGSCESIQKNDGSSFLLIRPSIIELSGYLPKLYVVVELGTVKLLSYHGKVLKEERLDGGHILDRINEGKLFMCLGIGNQTLNDSLLKDVYSEPSKGEGEIAFRSRQCSFFLENTPGLCNECQSLLTILNNMEDSYENDTLENDWSLSELKEEDEDEILNEENMNINECSKCLKIFKNNSSLSRHKRRCPNYSGTNEQKLELKQEQEAFHEDNMSSNECSKCLETFKNISSLNRHEKHCLKDPDFVEEKEISKRGEKSVVCDQCGKVLPHRTALTKHIRRSHDKTKTYTCPKCNKVFFENYRLKKHLSIHTGVKPFKCSRCKYCCVRKDNVFIHLRRVHKIVPTSNDVVTITDQIKSSESAITQKTESGA